MEMLMQCMGVGIIVIKDDLGLGLNELGVGILGLPASTLALCFVGTGTGTIISNFR
jgi:hypothetical protein